MSHEIAQDALEALDSQRPKIASTPGVPATRKASDAQRAAGIANLKRFNASRNGKPNMRHGIKSFIATGAAPTAIEKKLDAMEQGLIQDLGGKPSAAQICLLQALRTCLGVVMMTDAYVQQGGLKNFRNSRWIMEISAAHSNSIRLHLQALNVSWSGNDPNNLAEDLAKKRTKNSLSAVLAATEEPTVLPSWYHKAGDYEDVG